MAKLHDQGKRYVNGSKRKLQAGERVYVDGDKVYPVDAEHEMTHVTLYDIEVGEGAVLFTSGSFSIDNADIPDEPYFMKPSADESKDAR